MRVAATRAVRRPGAAARADGDHHPAVPQHLHHRAPSIGHACPPGLEWPADPQWGNFLDAFTGREHGRAARLERVHRARRRARSSLVISTMAGFAIGLLRIPGARLLLLLFLFGLTLPFEGIITPLYFLARQMGILNTRLAIVLPLIGLFMPFAVFWMRAHFVNMPREISEAARVDGASTWDLFWRIHVPLARRADRVAGHPHGRLDLEPVPARAGARRGPDAADDGRRPRRVPGPLRDRHPAAVRRARS